MNTHQCVYMYICGHTHTHTATGGWRSLSGVFCDITGHHSSAGGHHGGTEYRSHRSLQCFLRGIGVYMTSKQEVGLFENSLVLYFYHTALSLMFLVSLTNKTVTGNQGSTVPSCIVSRCTVPSSPVPMCTGPSYTVPRCTGPSCSVLRCTGSSSPVPRCTGPNYTVPRCIGPSCTVLRCSAQLRRTQGHSAQLYST